MTDASRWPNVLRRFAVLFAEAVALGDLVATEWLAEIALELQGLERLDPCALHEVFDHLEDGELRNLETPGSRVADQGVLVRTAREYVRLLREHARSHGTGDEVCRDSSVAYRSP